MTVVVVGHNEEIDALIERRRALGLDGSDEVWEGVYHMAPHANRGHADLASQLGYHLYSRVKQAGYRLLAEFNLGDGPNNFRVPDFGVTAERSSQLYAPTALMVGEIRSPDDETYAKFPFYAACEVGEIVVVDPADRSVLAFCWTTVGGYVPAADLESCGHMKVQELADLLDWPDL
jgi:hypothetical protein